MKNLCAGVVLAVCLAGCATTGPAVNPAQITATAERVFGDKNFVILMVPGSTGAVNETLVGGMSAVLGPRKLVRDARAAIARQVACDGNIAFAGTSPDKTESVVMEALKGCETGVLRGMTILYFGPDTPPMRQAIERTGAVARFRSLP
jgi:hypothetical protein